LSFSKNNLIHWAVVIVASLILVATFLFEQAQVSANEANAEEISIVTTAEASSAEEAGEDTSKKEDSPYKPIGAAMALGLGALGTSLAQSKIGAAGMGAMAERPETATMAVVMVALPETIVILGFVVAAMIIMF
jgi:V/A-type H+-transporting ATPase subunit K